MCSLQNRRISGASAIHKCTCEAQSRARSARLCVWSRVLCVRSCIALAPLIRLFCRLDCVMIWCGWFSTSAWNITRQTQTQQDVDHWHLLLEISQTKGANYHQDLTASVLCQPLRWWNPAFRCKKNYLLLTYWLLLVCRCLILLLCYNIYHNILSIKYEKTNKLS